MKSIIAKVAVVIGIGIGVVPVIVPVIASAATAGIPSECRTFGGQKYDPNCEEFPWHP